MRQTPERRICFAHGTEVLDAVDGCSGDAVLDVLRDVSPEPVHQVMAWGFRDIASRPGLPPRDRRLVTLGMLTAPGGSEVQLDVHINAALNVGLTPQQFVEALVHAAVSCGFPRALNATFQPLETFAGRGLLPVAGPPEHPHRPGH